MSDFIHSIAIQPNTKKLLFKRIADGWIVWLAGNANTHLQTYLRLHDNGNIQRITEGPDGRFDVLTIREDKQS
jgi:hypothetical protein